MDMKAMQHNRIRKLILEHLAPAHPYPVDSVMLRASLANLGFAMDEGTLKSYLAYLEERGYVKVEERKGFDITLVAIRAAGLDVLDGRCDDPGVGVKI